MASGVMLSVVNVGFCGNRSRSSDRAGDTAGPRTKAHSAPMAAFVFIEPSRKISAAEPRARHLARGSLRDKTGRGNHEPFQLLRDAFGFHLLIRSKARQDRTLLNFRRISFRRLTFAL